MDPTIEEAVGFLHGLIAENQSLRDENAQLRKQLTDLHAQKGSEKNGGNRIIICW